MEETRLVASDDVSDIRDRQPIHLANMNEDLFRRMSRYGDLRIVASDGSEENGILRQRRPRRRLLSESTKRAIRNCKCALALAGAGSGASVSLHKSGSAPGSGSSEYCQQCGVCSVEARPDEMDDHDDVLTIAFTNADNIRRLFTVPRYSLPDSWCKLSIGCRLSDDAEGDDDAHSQSSTTAASSISTITSATGYDTVDSLDSDSLADESVDDSDDDDRIIVRPTPELAEESTHVSAVLPIAFKRLRFCSCDTVQCDCSNSNDGEDNVNKHCIPTLRRQDYTWKEREATWHSMKELLLFKSQADRVWNDIRKGRTPVERGLEHRVKIEVPCAEDASVAGPSSDESWHDHRRCLVPSKAKKTQNSNDESSSDDSNDTGKDRYILRNRKRQRNIAREAVLQAQEVYRSIVRESSDDLDVVLFHAYRPYSYASQTLAAIIGLLDQKVAAGIADTAVQEGEEDQIGDAAIEAYDRVGRNGLRRCDRVPNKSNERMSRPEHSADPESDSTIDNGTAYSFRHSEYSHSPRRRTAMLRMLLDCKQHGYILPGMLDDVDTAGFVDRPLGAV